ncbi:Os01g0545800 [Oryza sativa Japonica Group]|uniref:Os01g0545800 protein n=1 Tax=Oryza sativa subsp. japonica TaxID=39947 RepID=A0A0P0V3R8_ORYSJ|nr:hypothetical protein EE612_003321 [Oryza sativa]BAS72594.1 Os01g0545800 [Oryza sativa Japonica Group]
MERDSGFNFFSQLPSVLGSSAASFNIYSQVSSSSAAHAPRAGLDGLDLNFNLQGAEEFPHIGEYENYLQSGGDQGGSTTRGSAHTGSTQPVDGNTVDGTTTFVPGQDFFEEEEHVEDAWGDDASEDVATPMSTDTRKTKRSLEKEYFSVKKCQELAFECGIEHDSAEVYAMGKMFQDPFQREFFCGQWTNEEGGDASSDDGGSTSSSEDELLSMALNNLKTA